MRISNRFRKHLNNFIFINKELIRVYYFLLLLCLLVFSCKKQPDLIAVRNAVVDSTVVAFQKNLYKTQIDSVFTKNNFNGIVSVSQNGQKIYEHGSGFEDFTSKAKLSTSSVFPIASVSKQFTAVLVLLQQEAGRLSTKDLVSKYLPEFRKPGFDKITIHQLLTHTSGISDFGENLQFESGTDYGYSNKGYLHLGEIIAMVSRKTLDQNFKELFARCGMTHSSTATLFKGQHFASAHTGNAGNSAEVANMPTRLAEKSISTAAGGILSTVEDLHTWNQMLYGGKILKPETLSLFKTNYVTRKHYVLGDVGYGYGIMTNIGAPEAYFHTGYVKGAPSLLIYYPESRTSVVILSNIANEATGKEAIFEPHRSIKTVADAVEHAAQTVRKEMVKPVMPE